MARYIEREALLELINEDCKYKNPTSEYARGCNEVCDWAIKTIKNIPTADVVPRAEIEKIFEEMEKNTRFVINLVEAMEFDSEEIRKSKLECYRDCLGYYGKLKKKYTEGTDGKQA